MKRFVLLASGFVAAPSVLAGAMVLGLPGGVSADDPSPPPGVHMACERMDPNAMEGMHSGMMHAGGQMADWMASGEYCAE